MINKEYTATFDDGIFKELFLEFIAYKQGLGFKYGISIQNSLSWINTRLNAYMLDTPVLTKTVVEELVSRRDHEAPTTQIKRICYLRHFAEFLLEMGYEAYIYPKHYTVIHHDYFAPYIFTKQQMASIIAASDSLPFIKRSPKHHIVWPAFIRVLYGCGLRLSETLNLKTQDVNLDVGIIYIEKSKNGTSRYVPISSSLKKYLTNYVALMKLDLASGGYFFPAPDNGRYALHSAYCQIKKLYEKAGIPRLGNGRLPRIHDVSNTHINKIRTFSSKPSIIAINY